MDFGIACADDGAVARDGAVGAKPQVLGADSKQEFGVG